MYAGLAFIMPSIDNGEIGVRVTARTEDDVLLEIEQAPLDGKKIREVNQLN